MKRINLIVAGSLVIFFAFITCDKDPEPPVQSSVNRAPVAKAGSDTSITLALCHSTGSVRLDGSASFDPDNSPISYSWLPIGGPVNRAITINDAKTSKPLVSIQTGGRYDIELTVTDPAGSVGRDTIIVNVIASTANGYDLDITIAGSFQFQDNYEDCYYCYPCCYYDYSYITNGVGIFGPIGTMSFYAWESADTATASNVHDTYFGLYDPGSNIGPSVSGISSVNLKKVFVNGGGPFSGTFTPNGGSAMDCDPNIFKTLTPLTVTGNLNMTTKTITLNIKGKIYF